MTGILHTDRVSTVEVVVSSDKLIKIVNFSISDGDSFFFYFLSHARVMLINSPFTFHYQAQTSPSLLTCHYLG